MNDLIYTYLSNKGESTLWCCESCTKEVREALTQAGNKMDVARTENASQTEMVIDLETERQAESEIRQECIDVMQVGMERIIYTFQGIMKEIGTKEAGESQDWPPVSVNATDDKCNTVEPKANSWSGIAQALQGKFVKGVVKEALKENVQEVKKEDERARNIILYRVPESKATELSRRTHEDMKFIEGLLREIDASNVDFDQVTRLGKRDKEKDRPLRFRVKDLSQKTTIMENVRYLREAEEKYNNVSVCHDLTPEQREKLKELVSEAAEKSKNEDGFLYKVKDQRGPYWEPRIIRFKRGMAAQAQQ